MSHDGANKYCEVVKNLLDEKISAPISVSGSGKPKEFFWRGFVSPTGSSRPTNLPAVHPNRAVGGGNGGDPVPEPEPVPALVLGPVEGEGGPTCPPRLLAGATKTATIVFFSEKL